MAATRAIKEGAWTHELFNDFFADPGVCIVSYCLPCVTYGQTAETVHGPSGSCINHGLKYWLYSCCCVCGLVAGPTRKAVRGAFKLPPAPAGLGDESNTDCIVHTIPCTACFAHCQEANELRARQVRGPLAPKEFTWAPDTPAGSGSAAAAAPTAAPKQAEMSKEAAPAAAPSADAKPTEAPTLPVSTQ